MLQKCGKESLVVSYWLFVVCCLLFVDKFWLLFEIVVFIQFMNQSQDTRKYAPATQRNREPILEVLLRILPARGNILEIASGTGQHGAFFAPHLSPRQWIPSDVDPQCLRSIQAWRNCLGADNLYPPLEIDAEWEVWPIEAEMSIGAIVNINMIHIAPWSACLGLLRGASSILPPGGILYLYGPYQQGENTAPSNLAFDKSLRNQNPEWGVRDLDEVVTAARTRGFNLLETVSMPANNFSLIFEYQTR